jgi:hypothetical protein
MFRHARSRTAVEVPPIVHVGLETTEQSVELVDGVRRSVGSPRPSHANSRPSHWPDGGGALTGTGPLLGTPETPAGRCRLILIERHKSGGNAAVAHSRRAVRPQLGRISRGSLRTARMDGRAGQPQPSRCLSDSPLEATRVRGGLDVAGAAPWLAGVSGRSRRVRGRSAAHYSASSNPRSPVIAAVVWSR